MRRRVPLFLCLVCLVLGSLGCPPSNKDGPGPSAKPSDACTKVGQSCEVSPGKLGTCVQKDGCPDPAICLVCQSQH